MANVVTITEADTQASIQKKIKDLLAIREGEQKGFDAKKFIGKITSYGDGLPYQRKIRDEWH